MDTPLISDNGVTRPMTEAEVAAWESAAADTIADQTARQTETAAALEARKEPLRRLGLTEDEINTVLGL